ncbi:MAG: hypothetical protein GXP16_19990 [Gammaproteobacteria bacterium]|nr:hypothetical protein [Gammaproteobacteria bacterium]
MKKKDIRRHISWYAKKGDEFIADETIVGIELNSLQQLFQVATEDPMYDCWEIKEQHVQILQKSIQHVINLKKYDYFVEATLVDE